MQMPFAKPHPRHSVRSNPDIRYPRATPPAYYSPGQMPSAYGMPLGIQVVGRTIVIFELGGAFLSG